MRARKNCKIKGTSVHVSKNPADMKIFFKFYESGTDYEYRKKKPSPQENFQFLKYYHLTRP